MRDFIVFVLIAAAVFFGFGEWQGWYIGIAGQTPIFVYKRDYTATVSRRTVSRTDFPFSVTGTVRHGTVRVQGYYEQPQSFQTGRAGQPERLVFEQEFSQGQRINISEIMNRGQGIYRVRLVFDNATGTFRIRVPNGAEL